MVQPTNMGAVQSKAWSEFLGHVEAFADFAESLLQRLHDLEQKVATLEAK